MCSAPLTRTARFTFGLLELAVILMLSKQNSIHHQHSVLLITPPVGEHTSPKYQGDQKYASIYYPPKSQSGRAMFPIKLLNELLSKSQEEAVAKALG